MASEHVEKLFSAALDDALTPAQDAAFHAHLAVCSACAASFATFTEAVQRLRALPPAAMPLPVHLPSEAPAAERATAAGWLRRLRPRALPFGAASGVAALAAAAIVVIGLTHGGGGTPATSSGQSPNPLGRQGAPTIASPAACPAGTTASLAPYAYRVSASNPSRPGQALTLAASDQSAAAGSTIQVSALLTEPLPELGAPGASASAASISIAPCFSVSGLSAATVQAPARAGAPGGAGLAMPPALGQAGTSSVPAGNGQVTIPPGTPSGTVFHVVATIPAGYPDPHQSPLSVSLAITVR